MINIRNNKRCIIENTGFIIAVIIANAIGVTGIEIIMDLLGR